VYQSVPRAEIIDAIVHLNDLHRQVRPANERELRAYERREAAAKTLLSNLPRTKEHPTLNTLLEIAEIFSLTIEGAHRLFGYDLANLRNYDLHLNGGRTHIVESYEFERDLLVDLPSELAPDDRFRVSGFLRDLILGWQTEVPIRALEAGGWRRPGTFYVHVGTEDSLGSSLPAGALALVKPVETAEQLRPHPRSIYLLQFGNGYRCSRCVVTGGKLHLLTSERRYQGPQDFAYPGAVRIAGRIRTFALRLPSPEYPHRRTLPFSFGAADLTLPWEQARRDQLFASEHKRFVRLEAEERAVRERLKATLHTQLSARTERRYRYPSNSQPHVNVLLYLTVLHLARYTDALRASGVAYPEAGRFSLQTLLNAKELSDLLPFTRPARVPTPGEVWERHRREFLEWPSLLSLNLSELRLSEERVLRLADASALKGLEPPLAAGSWMLMERVDAIPDTQGERGRSGWSRPIYVLRKGLDAICGYLERDGDRFVLLTQREAQSSNVTFHQDDLALLNRVTGIAVPV
jgi:hypothetical protein